MTKKGQEHDKYGQKDDEAFAKTGVLFDTSQKWRLYIAKCSEKVAANKKR